MQFSVTTLQTRTTAACAILAATICAGCGGNSNVSAAGSVPELSRGLIHEWKFDGNASDSVGNLSATLIGPVSYTVSPVGQGIVFNGTTTGVCLPATGDTQFQESYSVGAWALLYNYTTTSIWSTIVFDGDDRPGLDPWFIQVDPNGNLAFQTCGASYSYGLTGAGVFPLHTWVLVTGTYDKQKGIEALYVNGSLSAEALGLYDLTPVVALDPSANPGFGIGTNNYFQTSVYDMGWDGVISDVRIYNRALSANEVSALYAQGSSNLNPGRMRASTKGS